MPSRPSERMGFLDSVKNWFGGSAGSADNFIRDAISRGLIEQIARVEVELSEKGGKAVVTLAGYIKDKRGRPLISLTKSQEFPTRREAYVQMLKEEERLKEVLSGVKPEDILLVWKHANKREAVSPSIHLKLLRDE